MLMSLSVPFNLDSGGFPASLPLINSCSALWNSEILGLGGWSLAHKERKTKKASVPKSPTALISQVFGRKESETTWLSKGFPGSSLGKESVCRRFWFDSWVGKIPWRRDRLPTAVFWPRELHGLYSPWGHKESDMTERHSLSLTFWRVCYLVIIHSSPHFMSRLARLYPCLGPTVPSFVLLEVPCLI